MKAEGRADRETKGGIAATKEIPPEAQCERREALQPD